METSAEDYQRFQRNLCLLVPASQAQPPLLAANLLERFPKPATLVFVLSSVSIGDKLFNYYFFYSFFKKVLIYGDPFTQK
jgi:hypothetical protein